MASKPLAGVIVLVLDAAADLGRALALELAARGASVVCAGPVERDVARVVGEIAFGGGRARHLVADVAAEDGVADALARGAGAFGAPSVVLAGSERVAGRSPPGGFGDPEARARAVAETLAEDARA